ALMNCRGLAMGQRLAEALTPLLAGRKQVLDIAGGSGIYACTLAARHNHLSAVVLEQSPVDVIVGKEIEKHGMGDRVKVFCGDMFQDDWPDGSDVILFSNVLHDWDFPEVEALLRKAAEYLPQNGLLIIHDAFINDAKTGPLPVAEYSALLMNITQGKCYSHAEYTSILETLSFEVGPYQDTIADRGFMTAIRK
ncbi:MAG: class I SAM-dependent methyltransferase, partial [Verrucomicrobiae bacterium]|nr:class I SAM-dependent methyltransferase [Verrucomicrobiae bacterium]